MSRVFDALQRSGTELSGVQYDDVVAMATNVFEAPLFQEPGAPENSAKPAEITDPIAALELDEVPEAENAIGATESFPSLNVSIGASSRLVFFSEPDSLAAEKFRFLGVRLRHIRQKRALKKVLVTSSIPGEGKSLVSANLAGVLVRRKEKVLLIEGDLRRPVLAQMFGLGRLAGLADWLQKGEAVTPNIYHLRTLDFCIMPAGEPPANPLELMQSGRLSRLLESLTTSFDWIIVDSPPLLPLADTTVWARMTDGTLLVAREGTTQKGPLQRSLEVLKKTDLLGVVMNGCTDSDHGDYYHGYGHGYAPPESK